VLAAITFTQIVQLVVVAIVLHAVILAPVVVAVMAAWLERGENAALRNARGG
jgi:hypothetical protein